MDLTLHERHDRAAARWADAMTRRARSWRALEDSRWRLASSRVVLDRPGQQIRGGADGEASVGEVSDETIRALVSHLIDSDLLPRAEHLRVVVRPSENGSRCIACARPIGSTDMELEVHRPGLRLSFHRRCLELWALEIERRGSPQP
jgi:hypothetical protein